MSLTRERMQQVEAAALSVYSQTQGDPLGILHPISQQAVNHVLRMSKLRKLFAEIFAQSHLSHVEQKTEHIQ